jgi:hypothetical protein
MEQSIVTNNTQHSQESATIEEQFQYITKEEAAQKIYRTRMQPEVFARYVEAINNIKDGRVGVATTADWKGTRKNLVLVAKKLGVQLSTRKTFDGLSFWVATEEEVKARKRRR